MATAPDPVTLALTGMLPMVLIAAALIAFPSCLLLLWLYRRAVIRSMEAGGQDDAAPARAVTTAGSVATTLRMAEDDGRDAAETSRAAALLRQARLAPWRTAAIYGLAGFAFSAVMTVAYQCTADGEIRPVRSALFLWTFAWPLVLIARRVAASTGAARLTVATAYFLVLALLAALTLALNPGVGAGAIAVLWLQMNAPATLLLLAFLNRRVRAVGPLVIAFTVAVLLGMQVAVSLANEERRLRLIVEVGDRFGLGGHAMFLVIILAGAAVFALVGWLAVAWIRLRYEAGAINDESLETDAVWLVFGFTYAVSLAFEGALWTLAAVAAFAAHKAVAGGGFAVLRRLGRPRPASLLVLRVFSLGKRSERLFESVQKHWRHLGTVAVIAGPDLARSTVEPHEFLDFVTGRLGRRFIDGPAALEQRLAESSGDRDRRGRYRVAEFFCHRHTWRSVFRRLAGDCNAILMDLRGFCAENAGCLFEIQTLVQTVAVAKVVLVLDDRTDRTWLQQAVNQAWAGGPASAVTGGDTPSLRLVRYERSGQFPRLLRAVCAAAAS